jgi:hypothetical protein
VPIVPITNVLQVAENTDENFRQNSVEIPAENELEHEAKEDETSAEIHADSAADFFDPEEP